MTSVITELVHIRVKGPAEARLQVRGFSHRVEDALVAFSAV